MKNAYLLVTDLHLDFNKANRINYFSEIVSAMSDILEIVQKYRSSGYSPKVLFMGDLVDGSLSNASEAMQITEILRFFCSNFDSAYSVVGNHELTYAKDNPFWFLVSSIQDELLASVKRYVQPRGMNDTIFVPDVLADGEVSIYFNHYGIPAKTPEAGDVRIGVFHQNVGSNDICKMWGTFDNVEEASYIQGYHYCFFGHMHLAKGKYYLNESHTCCGEWLGSIGRTKINEILDDSLQVNIPVIRVSGGKFEGIEDNYITLKPFDECVDKVKLEAVMQSKSLVEERKQLALNAYTGDTLFNSLMGSVQGTSMEILMGILDKPWEKVELEYRTTLANPGVGSEDTEDTEDE